MQFPYELHADAHMVLRSTTGGWQRSVGGEARPPPSVQADANAMQLPDMAPKVRFGMAKQDEYDALVNHTKALRSQADSSRRLAENYQKDSDTYRKGMDKLLADQVPASQKESALFDSPEECAKDFAERAMPLTDQSNKEYSAVKNELTIEGELKYQKYCYTIFLMNSNFPGISIQLPVYVIDDDKYMINMAYDGKYRGISQDLIEQIAGQKLPTASEYIASQQKTAD